MKKTPTALSLSFLLSMMVCADAGARTPDPFATGGGIWTVASPCTLDGIGFVEGGLAMIYYKGDGDTPSGGAFYSVNAATFSMERLSANVADTRYRSTFLQGALRPDGTLFVVHGYTERGNADPKREQCILKRESQ